MVTANGDLAVSHMERLSAELSRNLKSVEKKIADLEAENVMGDERIDKLAEDIVKLGALEEVPVAEGQEPITGPAWDPHILKVFLTKATKTKYFGNPNGELLEICGNYRNHIISMINAMDLVMSALKKAGELEKQKDQYLRTTKQSVSGARTQLGSSAIIRSQELERHRIAREIHDGPAQAIANVVLRMDILRNIYEKNPSKVPVELFRMKKIAEGALNEIRGFIFDLRPMTLQDLGLVATLKRVVTSIRELSEIDIRFVLEGDERPLGQLATLTTFRIAQEAMNNVKKYSEASTAWVHLKYLENKVVLIIEDNGKGFNPEEVAENQKNYVTFGLLGMQERADDIGADLTIDSEPGAGTKVALVIPTDDPEISRNHNINLFD
ncbi:MAG TPA: sensor histidine kinase [bacterium]|jgi:signal transduction histidine kinase